jgi:hypothetical protein
MRSPVLLLLLGLLAATPAVAQIRTGEPKADSFSILEQNTIHDYFGTVAAPRRAEDGWDKRTVLPAAANPHDLPADLESRLPPLPIGIKRVIVGDCVLLVETQTSRILDSLPGAARKP